MLACLLMAILLGACASSVTIEKSWRAEQAPAVVYKKLLVVAATHDSDLRETFENILAETLQDHGVAAVRSYQLVDDLNKADVQQLQALAEQLGADAVVITRGISDKDHIDYQYSTGTLENRTFEEEKTGPDSSETIAMSAVGIAPRETDFEEAILRTRLFDATSAKLVWSATSKIIDAGRRADACWDLSAKLVKALGRDHVIEINATKFQHPSL